MTAPATPMQVLAADDDRVARQLIKAALRKWGYAVRVAENGLEALACLERPDGPDLAVVDWSMPGLDGVEVCARARAARPDTPPYIVLLTGRSGSSDVVRGLRAGADDYVIKPVDLEVLRARLEVGARVATLQRTLTARARDLAAAEHRYRHLVEGVGVAVWEADARWRLRFLNREGERVLGHPHGFCVDADDFWLRVVHVEDREGLAAFRERVLEASEPASFEYRVLRDDGRLVWLRDTVRVVRDTDDQVARLRGVTADVTAQRQSQQELEAALQMQTSFTSFASHQLRTPLSAVKWLLELAAEDPEIPDEPRALIGDALGAATRLVGLVNDLLSTARLESGRVSLQMATVDLADLTRTVVSELWSVIARHAHHVEVYGDGTPRPVLADRTLLREVLVNLLTNAIKYTPDGGRIRVALAVHDAEVRWSVEDNGLGIPPASIPRLFEKFYRGENIQVIETEGTGLGLYMVRLILGRVGGRVWCESEEGRGSRFTFALPHGAAPEPSAAPGPALACAAQEKESSPQ